MRTDFFIVNKVSDLRAKISSWRRKGFRTGLVPTMGALHEGHLSLVRKALEHADKVIVSIFVNPSQFAPDEDFARYPRREEEDCKLLADTGAHLVFIPAVEEMYPDDNSTSVHVKNITDRLEGAFRPGHFDGVATVVTKLLLQCMPDIAVFGEKDYQQLCVIKRLVKDLFIPVGIIGAPIIRDEYGLALSSRNDYLSEEDLKIAREMNKILSFLATEIRNSPEEVNSICNKGHDIFMSAGFSKVDYIQIADPDSLRPLTTLDRPARLLCAAYIEHTRILDNITVCL
jgi:pantoate--beta-alanine ligase